MIVVLMGVSGSGKSLIGARLASALSWPFYDADEFHSPANLDKMSHGVPLTDADRAPWLAALRNLLQRLAQAGQPAVVACSALKQAYRDTLQVHPDVRFVHLKGDFDLIRRRLAGRSHHFVKADLLVSQFATLEEPVGVPAIDVTQPPEAIISQVKQALGLADFDQTIGRTRE